jgi:NTP pyrophosphatase (non-canonical NTP hydrolase)
MKNKIAELYKLQQNNLIYSPWGKEATIVQRTVELQEEVEEAMVEVKQERWDAFKDEIGDVLWDCLGVIAKAEHDGHFTIKDVLDNTHAKFTERKPFLLEERHVTKEEESSVWHAVKAKQKIRNKNERN